MSTFSVWDTLIEDGGTTTGSVSGDFAGDGFVGPMLVRNQTTVELLRVTRKNTLTLPLHSRRSARSAPSRRPASEASPATPSSSAPTRRRHPLVVPAKTNQLLPVHNEIIGKSGIRRAVPGQYVAVDPAGRSVMHGAIEKQTLVYILNRDNTGKITVTSPLEAHKANTICHGIADVDVGYDNPTFAALEVDYHEQYLPHIPTRIVKKALVFNELDLGLNHVVRKHAQPVPDAANYFFPLPALPSVMSLGVIVCSHDQLFWCHLQHDPITVPLPHPDDVPIGRTVIVTSHVCLVRKTRSSSSSRPNLAIFFACRLTRMMGLSQISPSRISTPSPRRFSLACHAGAPLLPGRVWKLVCSAPFRLGRVNLSLEDLSQTTQQCRHLYVLKSVDIVDTPTRTVGGRLVCSKVPTDDIDEIHCFHSLSPLLDMKIAPSPDSLPSTCVATIPDASTHSSPTRTTTPPTRRRTPPTRSSSTRPRPSRLTPSRRAFFAEPLTASMTQRFSPREPLVFKLQPALSDQVGNMTSTFLCRCSVLSLSSSVSGAGC